MYIINFLREHNFFYNFTDLDPWKMSPQVNITHSSCIIISLYLLIDDKKNSFSISFNTFNVINDLFYNYYITQLLNNRETFYRKFLS